MSDAEPVTREPARRRSSADTRERLLASARSLFAERGFESSTVREIGQRAEVDPALIARYFGSKAGLYLESIRQDAAPIDPGRDLTDPIEIGQILERTTRFPSPTMFAAVRPHDDAELQAAALENLRARIVAPARRAAVRAGHPDADLRAEVVTAALAGVTLSRSSGALSTLSTAQSSQVAALVAAFVGALLSGSAT